MGSLRTLRRKDSTTVRLSNEWVEIYRESFKTSPPQEFERFTVEFILGLLPGYTEYESFRLTDGGTGIIYDNKDRFVITMNYSTFLFKIYANKNKPRSFSGLSVRLDVG
jgi:hypothetical protein